MTNQFVLANVLHRPMRALVSIMAISLEVVMILMVVGVTSGMVADSAARQQGIGADIFLQPPNASVIFSTGGAVMPISDKRIIEKINGVRVVAPMLTQLVTEGQLVTLAGIDYPSFNEVSGGLTFLAGGPFSTPTANEMIVDDLEQKAGRLKVGDSREFRGEQFKVCGVVKHGKGARIYVPLLTLQEVVGATARASMMLIKCDRPEQVNEVIRRIEAALPGYGVFSVQDWVSRIVNTRLPELDAFISVVVGVAVVIGAFAIFLSMYTTIAERTRDIGILKSLGASKSYIVNLILREATLISMIGLVVGILLTLLGRGLLLGLFPTQQVLLSLAWMGRATLLVMISGVVGAIYPALKAASKDPLLALAYE
jgi:putative ABC transport system permease protein